MGARVDPNSGVGPETWLSAIEKDTSTGSSAKTFTVDAGRQWRVDSIRVRFETTTDTSTSPSATDSRQLAVAMTGTSTADEFFRVTVSTGQDEGLVRHYTFAPELSDQTSFASTDQIEHAIPRLTLGPRFKVKVFDTKGVLASRDALSARMLVSKRENVTT